MANSDTKITPGDIVSMLPFDEQFKKSLLAKLEAADNDRRYNLEEALWDAYDTMYEIVRDKNLEESMKQMSAGDVTELSPNFYKKALEKTDHDMTSSFFQSNTSNELTSVREKLMEFIK